MTAKEMLPVLSTVVIPDPWLERLKQLSPRLQFSILPVNKAEEIPQEIWANTEILYTLRILPQLAQVPRLRWVQFHRSSLEHVREEPFLKSEDIRLTTLSGANAPQAAEFILTALLALGHQVAETISRQPKGEWDAKRWRQWKPLELRGSTVGIVGYGSVGRELARLLQPFDVKILATKKDVMQPEDQGYILDGKGDPEGNFFHRLYPPQALRSMLRECDYVVVTVPLTEQTASLFNKETLEGLKPGSYLVSISDRRIVSADLVASAVQDKLIRGAVLDSYEISPPPPDHPVWKLPEVILTPRIAWRSEQDIDRAMTFFKENLRRYLEGAGLLNRFELSRGY